MQYQNMVEGRFRSRPNRFIAMVEINGKTEICHVKNTGRCKELLTEGATVYLQKVSNPERKTKYDLITVMKKDRLINMDSQAPNKVFGEWIEKSGYFSNVTLIKPECKYGNSRFDFYIEASGQKHFVEVKGVTLEEEGVLMFPDAPTERGVKHLRELMAAIQEGYNGHIFFVAQMESCRYFTPNRKTHPEFADALLAAEKHGVMVHCVNCQVTPDSLVIQGFVPIQL